MKLIFTRSKTPFSWLIRWGLSTDVSHFALVFNSPAGGLMFESNLLGTHPRFYKTAQKHMTIVNEFDITMDVKDEDKIWDEVVDKYDGKGYDFPGFIYFCWRGFLLKFFNLPLPKKNAFAKPGMYLCISLFEIMKCHIPPVLRDRISELDLEMTPPNVIRDLIIDFKLEGNK